MECAEYKEIPNFKYEISDDNPVITEALLSFAGGYFSENNLLFKGIGFPIPIFPFDEKTEKIKISHIYVPGISLGDNSKLNGKLGTVLQPINHDGTADSVYFTYNQDSIEFYFEILNPSSDDPLPSDVFTFKIPKEHSSAYKNFLEGLSKTFSKTRADCRTLQEETQRPER